MKNATKLRKKAEREGSSASSSEKREIALAMLQKWIDEDNMEEMDRMADALGIERCSDYVNKKVEEDRRNGLCTCPRKS